MTFFKRLLRPGRPQALYTKRSTDQRISRLSWPKTSPVKYLNTSTTTIVEQQITTTTTASASASAKNNGNINNIKDYKAALSNVLSSIGLRSLTNFNCQSFVQSQ